MSINLGIAIRKVASLLLLNIFVNIYERVWGMKNAIGLSDKVRQEKVNKRSIGY